MIFLQIFENICLVGKFSLVRKRVLNLCRAAVEIIFALIQLHKCLINKYWEIVGP